MEQVQDRGHARAQGGSSSGQNEVAAAPEPADQRGRVILGVVSSLKNKNWDPVRGRVSKSRKRRQELGRLGGQHVNFH